MIEIFMVIFAIMIVVGLIGTIYAYAQPSASDWCMVYVFMLFIGVIGFLFVMTLMIFSKGV